MIIRTSLVPEGFSLAQNHLKMCRPGDGLLNRKLSMFSLKKNKNYQKRFKLVSLRSAVSAVPFLVKLHRTFRWINLLDQKLLYVWRKGFFFCLGPETKIKTAFVFYCSGLPWNHYSSEWDDSGLNWILFAWLTSPHSVQKQRKLQKNKLINSLSPTLRVWTRTHPPHRSDGTTSWVKTRADGLPRTRTPFWNMSVGQSKDSAEPNLQKQNNPLKIKSPQQNHVHFHPTVLIEPRALV